MDFSLTEEQIDLRETIIRFARQELNDDLAVREKCGAFPRQGWEKCCEMSISALPFPEEYGGCGVDFLTTALSINALGYACRDAGLVHALTTQILCGMQIMLFGSDEQKQRFLPALCSGEKIFAQAITEPGSGSDAMAMASRAEKADGGYLLNGTKTFITNGPVADVVGVFAVTNPEAKSLGRISCLMVEKDFPGFQRCRPLEKMGLCTLQNGELVFEDCEVPAANLLGREGQGTVIFGDGMEWERILLPAAHLGTLERVLETTVVYAKERNAFGQAIGRFQAVSSKIADMKMKLELGRLALFNAATQKGNNKRASIEASICKLFISESLKQACLDAVQIRGGYGYSREYEIERDLRDSIASTIYSGTSEIQQSLITRMLGL